MQSKLSLLGAWIVVILAVSIFGVLAIFVPTFQIVPSHENNTSLQINSGIPIRLKIPKMNVDAPIEQVGVTSSGALGVPRGPVNAAWFNLGPRPGDKGTAIIDGHFGWMNSTPAVFDTLGILQKGDKIYVEDESGTSITFVVRETRIYGQYDDATSVFTTNDEVAHLNLITCEGVWDQVAQTYSSRLVVFSDRI